MLASRSGASLPFRFSILATTLAATAPATLSAQVSFQEHVISSEINGPRAVHAADIDRDGDIDIVTGNGFQSVIGELLWFENDGGSPPAFTEHLISGVLQSFDAIYATDLDGDSDVDVLAGSLGQGEVTWYENDGGVPPAFTMRTIDSSSSFTSSVHAADVDGDGDVDVLAASSGGHTVSWYENDGGVPPGFTERTIAPVLFAESVFAADVDGDSHTDVLSASFADDEIAWHENDGGAPPMFTDHSISATALEARSVHAADLDGDEDTDILSASQDDDTVAWYENDGATPPTFVEHVVSTSADGAWSVDAHDVDGDGDTDVLSASAFDDTIAWYESDGAAPPTFVERIISSTADSARDVFAIDLDADGDTDVLSASFSDDTVAWHENLGSAATIVGATVRGMTLRPIGCTNLTTGETGSGSGPGTPGSWTCAQLGVAVTSGDRVLLFGKGVTDDLAGTVRGSTAGLALPRRVTCQNLTTGQTVEFLTAQAIWDCEAEGLEVGPGHRLQQSIGGFVP